METFTDDTVVALASFLSPHDMLSLALSCKRFGDKHGTTTSRSRRMAARDESSRKVRQRTESISLMEGAARTVLQAKWSDEERNALPRHEDESWIGIYHEFLKLFRYPLQFDKLVCECTKYVDISDKTKVNTKRSVYTTDGTAICSNIMRAGKHCVSFRVNSNDGIRCGIMRPTTKNIKSLRKCHPVCNDLSRFSLKDYETLHTDNNVDCCLLVPYSGYALMRERWKRYTNTEM